MPAKNGLVRVGKRVIGQIDHDKKIYAKQVDKRKHLYEKLDAWGIDGNFLKHTLLPDNYRVRLFECREQKVYETDAKTLDEKGVWLHFKDEKADYGAQAFLARQYWT